MQEEKGGAKLVGDKRVTVVCHVGEGWKGCYNEMRWWETEGMLIVPCWWRMEGIL